MTRKYRFDYKNYFLVVGIALLLPSLLVLPLVFSEVDRWQGVELAVLLAVAVLILLVPGLLLVGILKALYQILAVLANSHFSGKPVPRPGFWARLLGLAPFFQVLDVVNNRLKTVNLENQIFSDTAAALYRSATLQELLDTVLARLVTHFGADFGLIFLLEGDQLKLASEYPAEEMEIGKTLFSLGEGLVGWCAQEGEALLSQDVQGDRRYISCVSETRSQLTVPLQVMGHTCGVLVLGSREPSRFEEGHLGNLHLMSSQIGLVVENARLYRSMEDLAIRDGLTGLYNHRYFQERLEEELERAQRYNRSLSLVMLDIDDFKEYNDLFGHPYGDYLLREVGHFLMDRLRRNDVLARYGGDELVLILPETDSEAACALVERLKVQVEDHQFGTDEIAASEDWKEENSQPDSLKGKIFRWLNTMKLPWACNNHRVPPNLTISAGICSYPSLAENREELVRKADHALLEAKKQGKNQVCLWGGKG